MTSTGKGTRGGKGRRAVTPWLCSLPWNPCFSNLQNPSHTCRRANRHPAHIGDWTHWFGSFLRASSPLSHSYSSTSIGREKSPSPSDFLLALCWSLNSEALHTEMHLEEELMCTIPTYQYPHLPISSCFFQCRAGCWVGSPNRAVRPLPSAPSDSSRLRPLPGHLQVPSKGEPGRLLFLCSVIPQKNRLCPEKYILWVKGNHTRVAEHRSWLQRWVDPVKSRCLKQDQVSAQGLRFSKSRVGSSAVLRAGSYGKGTQRIC